MSLNKQELRTHYKSLRASLSEEELEKMSLQITENAISFIEARSELNHFHLFFPIPKQREINTYPIKEYLERRGSRVYTSRVALNSLLMQTLLLKQPTSFQLDKWGIPVPVAYEVVDNRLIQVVFVPLLAYDQKGNRIGFGKGYYDVFLSTLKPSVLKIGLSFFDPERNIPYDLHDIPMDFCVTPENIITF